MWMANIRGICKCWLLLYCWYSCWVYFRVHFQFSSQGSSFYSIFCITYALYTYIVKLILCDCGDREYGLVWLEVPSCKPSSYFTSRTEQIGIKRLVLRDTKSYHILRVKIIKVIIVIQWFRWKKRISD